MQGMAENTRFSCRLDISKPYKSRKYLISYIDYFFFWGGGGGGLLLSRLFTCMLFSFRTFKSLSYWAREVLHVSTVPVV